ncbi:hypothetical protein RF11_03349 [Thelohanellus kitauei]|uniref:Uncharacterized protein n=1 Tax=Thelohanellus kitauei TaxID=669202 RepID=A0A0C2IZR6_THEKT|nr:hypothetical protein RF11_03349 [Thelohanellus kitauei]
MVLCHIITNFVHINSRLPLYPIEHIETPKADAIHLILELLKNLFYFLSLMRLSILALHILRRNEVSAEATKDVHVSPNSPKNQDGCANTVKASCHGDRQSCLMVNSDSG